MFERQYLAEKVTDLVGFDAPAEFIASLFRDSKEREKNNFPNSVRDFVPDQGKKPEPGEPGEGFLTQRWGERPSEEGQLIF